MNYPKKFERPASYEQQEERKWSDINAKKEDSMMWLNAMNNACLIVAEIAARDKLEKDELFGLIRELRDEVYSLNTMKPNI